MEIYLIRHTTPAVQEGTCYGQSDIPLSDSFPVEYSRMSIHLPATWDAVFSSPLLRCKQLALKLNSMEGMKTDNRLMELNFGSWEMKKWDDLPNSELDTWMKNFVEKPPPGGENFIMLYDRAGQFFEELKKQPFKRVAIVTHAGIIRAIIARILEIPLKNAFKIPVSYASVTKLRLDQDTCYCGLEYLNKE